MDAEFAVVREGIEQKVAKDAKVFIQVELIVKHTMDSQPLKRTVIGTGALAAANLFRTSPTFSRVAFAVLGVFAILSTARAFNPPQPQIHRQVCIKVVVYEGVPAHRDQSKVLTKPTMFTLEGQPVTFFCGGKTPKERLPEGSEELRWGTHCKLLLGKIRESQIPLDLTLTCSEKSEPDSETIVVNGRIQRVLRTVPLGETITLSLPGDEQRQVWMEVHLSEVPREPDPKLTALKSAAG